MDVEGIKQMIVVYEVIDENQIDYASGEDHNQIAHAERSHNLGDKVSMGSDRRWQIVSLETYIGELGHITLALVHPVDLTAPDRSEWDQTVFRSEYPDISLELKAMPNAPLQLGGWNMEGKPSSGRLMGAAPTDHPTRLRSFPLPFVVGSVDTYRPVVGHCYTAIHVCQYVDSPLPELTTAR